jgi:NhaP-type Na+/H+ and K+/H+ antiporter
MNDRFTFRNFLKDMGMRLGAAAVVLVIFFGLGYINRTDFLGLSRFLNTRFSFFTAAFILVGIVSLSWMLYQDSKN